MRNDIPQISYEAISPFGPKFGIIKLNDFFVNKLIELTDDILKDKNRENYGQYLAGQIKEEPIIDLQKLQELGLYDNFNKILHHHLSSVLNIKEGTQITTRLTDMWVVSQYEHEYNPVHWHEGSTLSGVVYLKIPEYVSRNIEHKSSQDGNIVFINNSQGSPTISLEAPLFSHSPKVGDMLIFPSRMMHCVYPFLGQGERRSIAFNGLHFFTDKEGQKVLYI